MEGGSIWQKFLTHNLCDVAGRAAHKDWDDIIVEVSSGVLP
jgi:hypothetical protein